jgi:capsular polysaccharide biosynthesis protein
MEEVMELLDYLRVIQKRLGLIVLLVLISCTLSGSLFIQTSHSAYQAVSKLIVNKTNVVGGQQQIDTTTVGANIMLINTYKELIRSEPILQEVIKQNPQLHLTVSKLALLMKVSSVANSQVMSITIQDSSYERAAQIANAVVHVFKDSLPKIMNVDNVSILTEASLSEQTDPIQTSFIVVLFVTLVVSTVLSVLLVFLLDYFDHTVHSESDVMKLLGATPLITITQMRKKSMKPIKSSVPAKQGGEAGRAKLSH